MYLARFSYDVLPINRGRAIDFIRQEMKSARDKGLNARLLIPLTRGEKGAALQFEVELTSLDQLDQFRQSGVESTERTGKMDARFQRDPHVPAWGGNLAAGRSRPRVKTRHCVR